MTEEPADHRPATDDPDDQVEPRLATDPDPDPDASPLPDAAPGRGQAEKHPDPEPATGGTESA